MWIMKLVFQVKYLKSSDALLNLWASAHVYQKIFMDLLIRRLSAFKKGIKTISNQTKTWRIWLYVFMAESYCDNCFVHSFHFRNMLPPIKHVGLNLSNFKSRVLDLFCTFPDSNYELWVDNLHMPVTFIV